MYQRTLSPLVLLSVLGSLVAQDPAPPPSKLSLDSIKSISFNGEYRLRYAWRRDYDFNKSAGANPDAFAQRVRAGVDVEVNDRVDVGLQLQDSRVWGIEANTTTGFSPGLDFHVGYLRYRFEDERTITAGRQEIALGSERLVSTSDWSNVGRVFDGLVYDCNVGEWGSKTFAVQTKERAPAATANYADAYLIGTYLERDKDGLDTNVYLLYFTDDETVAGGTENRATIGGFADFRRESFGLGGEVATQFGDRDGADIPIGDTLGVNLNASLFFGGGLEPFVRVDGYYASGDDPGSTDNERFSSLFAHGHQYNGVMDLAEWENLQEVSVTVGIKPTERSNLRLSYHMFEANEQTDRFSGPGGSNVSLAAGGPAGRSRDIGDEIDLVFDWRTESDLEFQAGYATFLPGAGAKAAAGGDDAAHFFYVESRIRF